MDTFEITCEKCSLKASDIDITSSKKWKCPSLTDEYEFVEKTKQLINYEDRKTSYICDMGFMYAKLINNDYISVEFNKTTRNFQMIEMFDYLHNFINKYKGIDLDGHMKRQLHREIGCFNIMSISYNSDDILLFNHFISKYNLEWDWSVFGNVPHNISFANKKKYSIGIDGDGQVSVANIRHMKITHGNTINLFISDAYTLLHIMMAITTLKKGGYLLSPLFVDCNLQNLNTLYLLSMYFEKISIIQPFILERPYDCSYILCENYKEMNTTIYNKIMSQLNILPEGPNKYIDFGVTDEFIDDFVKIYKKLINRQCTNLLRDIDLVDKHKNADILDVTKSMKSIYKQSYDAWIEHFKFAELEDIDKMNLFVVSRF